MGKPGTLETRPHREHVFNMRRFDFVGEEAAQGNESRGACGQRAWDNL